MTVIKIIVVCLALANAGYFLWIHGIGQSPAVPESAAPTATLKLASEMPASAAGDLSASHEEGAAIAGNERHCVTVGPFKDVAETSHAASTLRAGGYDPRQRVVDGDVWAGVWVYLPMAGSHAASDQTLAKLKGAGLNDSLLMPGPSEASVISLGLFSDQRRAQARIAQVQALGFNPVVADRKRAANLYWIDIELKAADGPLNPSDLQGEAGHINRLQVKACPPSEPPAGAAS